MLKSQTKYTIFKSKITLLAPSSEWNGAIGLVILAVFLLLCLEAFVAIVAIIVYSHFSESPGLLVGTVT
jgi:hypothetical protein